MTDKNKNKMKSKQKLYCYVDESGQDTKGKLFVVGIVVTGNEKEELSPLLRLADAIAGFIRDGIEKHSDYIVLFNKLKREHFIQLIK